MNKGRTPAPSNHASRPSFDICKAMIMTMTVEAPQNHQQAKSKVSATDHVIWEQYIQTFFSLFKALVRDGFRCVITGDYDYSSVFQNGELEQEMLGATDFACTTECAHIFPESTNAKISGKNAQSDKVRFPTYLDAFLFIIWR
jgi:hypothetical protein